MMKSRNFVGKHMHKFMKKVEAISHVALLREEYSITIECQTNTII